MVERTKDNRGVGVSIAALSQEEKGTWAFFVLQAKIANTTNNQIYK